MPSATPRPLKAGDRLPIPISVIIPVWQEGPVIKDTIAHVVAVWNRLPLDLIVVDGHPGGTSLLHLEKDCPCRTVISSRGRGRQMNAGAAVARGDVLLFLHTDSRLPDDAPALIQHALQPSSVSAGAFDLAIDADHFAFRLIERTASIRSRLTRIPFGDQAQFIHRRIFERIGGYPEIPLFEDVALMHRLKSIGQRIAFVPQPHRVTTSARRWHSTGILRNTLRNWALQFGYGIGISPTTLSKYYR